MKQEPIVDVLFVEDSEIDVELAVRALGKEGLPMSWSAVCTEPALRSALAERMPEIILSDFSMPAFDGMKALEIAKQLAPEVPFIFVSGTIGEERAIEAIRCGATDYVLKDNMRRLGTAIRRALTEAAERLRVRAAEEERARLVEILEATSDYVGMSDPDGRQIYLNAAGRRMTGITPAQIPGALIFDIYPPWARERIEGEARPTAAQRGLWEGESAMLSPQGTEIPVSQVIIAHRNAEGGVRFYSAIARDISERKAYEARIRHLANYDALCDLPNRSLLADRASQAMVHARRTGRVSALIVLNVDRFKLVNEAYGQGAGDALLKLIAQRLASSMREGDTAARLGADSFAVLAADLARPGDATALARKLQETAGFPFTLDGRVVHFTFSVGVSTFPRDGEEFELLLRNAEAAMQRVKEAGGNALQYYAEAMTKEVAERVELETALRTALERGELSLHYQPQVELASGRIAGVEALMRWQRPQRGAVSPAQFIPLAEECGLIRQLGEWSLDEGCRQLAAWDRAGLAPVRLAVNVSARQFREAGFVEVVERVVREHGIGAGRLELEITEGVLIEDREQAIAILERLNAIGVLIAVDDFGTGYSSLSYLSGLPVDCLKIDRAFVTQAAGGGRDAAITQAIISLAHALGLRVLAEGVETPEQREFLRAHACDEAQGYFYARPCSAPDAAALIRLPKLPPAKP
ncbi:MAG TPA: EAL domain-containing protein [Burkholderiales bacterium]|nr:EAL domain-containing protein [Burkholderiales bacterium]